MITVQTLLTLSYTTAVFWHLIIPLLSEVPEKNILHQHRHLQCFNQCCFQFETWLFRINM